MKTKFLLLIFLLPLFVFAQITQIGGDIDGEAAGDLSGISISISADGSIVAIGSADNDGVNGTTSGHVRVYQNTGGTWTQIGSDIDGEAQDDISGYYVSLSADGNILAIGAPWNDGNGVDSGHVRVYQNTGGTWTQIGDDIDGEAAFDNSGESVSLSADGSILAIGAINNVGVNGFDSGHVRVYQNTGGTWTQIGDDIDGEAEGDLFGVSVGLSNDGSIVAIGGWLNDGNGIDSGHVRVFQNTGGTWTQIGEDIDGEAADDRAAYISLSANGNTVAIGAPLNDGINGADSGHIRVYQNTGGTWTQIGEDIDGEGDDDRFGLRTTISDDASIVASGGAFNDGNGVQSGHVRIFKNVGGTWIQRGADIDGEVAGDRFGYDERLSADGSIVAGSARSNDDNGNNSGHVRVFDLSSVLGIDDNSLLDFSVYPSPSSGILNVQSNTAIIQIEIYNLLGQLVKSNSNRSTIDISSVDQGIYFIKVMDENGNFGSQKVVKK
jgi:hypothetical protein